MSIADTQPSESILEPGVGSRAKPMTVDKSEQALIDVILAKVQAKISPVWPLADYVAVNPYAGFADQAFLSARSHLRTISDLETLMPFDFYRKEYALGAFDRHDIAAAIDELVADGVTGAECVDVNQIVVLLEEQSAAADTQAHEHSSQSLHTLAELFDQYSGTDWRQMIDEEISKHCAAHYDQGQAIWKSPWRDLPLYEAWRISQKHNLAAEVLGLTHFRQIVAQLPDKESEAVAALLKRLDVPRELWERVIECEAFQAPGWSAWTHYQHVAAGRNGEVNHDFAGLMAIRLAYEVAISEQHGFRVDWRSLLSVPAASSDDDALIRFALLTASEIAYRKQLVSGLLQAGRVTGSRDIEGRKLAQMVFCIDVRSERMRRHLESASGEIETFGFAGFFGLPIEFVPLDLEQGSAQVPALISPQFKVKEEVDSCDESRTARARQRLSEGRYLRKAWKEFQASATSCFGFVESTGLLFGAKLLQQSLGLGRLGLDPADYLAKTDRERLGPSLRGLSQQGITTSKQVDAAESILRGIGITDNFARLVVFCGHGSSTENNPLQAGLDCGACGGHSGKSNARLAARLLNQISVRRMLAARGIEIPDDTRFVAALHNTTTDEMQFFDRHELPHTHENQLDELAGLAEQASLETRRERMPALPGPSDKDLIRRSRDWSEVRPEWGLAGNAAFIAAPRRLTQQISLEGRSFLHSYDYRLDPDFAVLEQIMTAPLVVAQWINMQYYASTVDHKNFGSGTKALHNVVGRAGVFSGNGGDLMTGLPWQSIHDGHDYYHKPLRLQAIIAAPREAVESILAKHGGVANLLQNGWLKLTVIDNDVYYRYSNRQTWEELASAPSSACEC